MESNQANDCKLELFFDGGCPLCGREVAAWKRMDRDNRLCFTDIDNAHFKAADYGRTQEELMARMHARLPNGTWISGVEVFRTMGAIMGFGPLVWMSRWPGISQLLDLGYHLFARNRLRLTGRCRSGHCSIKKT